MNNLPKVSKDESVGLNHNTNNFLATPSKNKFLNDNDDEIVSVSCRNTITSEQLRPSGF